MSSRFQAVAVFCGSRFGHDPAFREAAAFLGQGIARHGWRLIYGGGHVGLMGEVADAVLRAGGQVSGVIPHFLSSREVMHERVSDLEITDSMHARKQSMYAQSDAFLVLPGGLGTFDEFFEVLTWRQLRLHDKPILVIDVAGWGRELVAVVDAAIERGFAEPGARELFTLVGDVSEALAALEAHVPAVQEGDPALL
ncbi:TIGR00730 family Rossman fold protein [Rhizosaccharibacter radicis]|uniref:Cytokinin riboside 5'-monophosphate phosphoribohydrolase n=1 Tax=Rhizosaccharibacter radicis TaxID=2782605 RepID=A0ABT1VYR0_9PROT|nr:TIGR00730 family Rossman fold protein [Acetobacteraceae bacterium KSS12]